ncbi:Replication factor C subunit 1 [Oopsacas minuta]|uniref:Replication factor C subunit 1 n=1 Tax=Oopsacas minuta TaxID=111878 RepID=A0AAV7JJS1_9METZ|nr:Replication factor C subunit 1 [Oopsacas minuta]
MEDIRTLFQQASKKADIKKQISKKRTRQIIDSDSDDECVIYPTKSKINSNKHSVKQEAVSVKTSPLDYFTKHSNIQDPISKASTPPVKKLRTDTDSQDNSQGTNTLIQNIGDLDIQISPIQYKPSIQSPANNSTRALLTKPAIHSPPDEERINNSVVNQSAIQSPVADKINTTPNTSFTSTGKCETPKPALSKHNSSNASNYFAYMNRAGPVNLGCKEIPTGQDNCLGNLTFVITGVLDSLERDGAKELIQKYGGRVVGSISKKVTHLLVGVEAGESKLEKARQLKVHEICEDDLLEMIRTRSSVGSKQVLSTSAKKKAKVTESKVTPNKPILCQSEVTPLNEDVKMDISNDNPILLVDKYRPTCVREIIGSAREASVPNKLIKWLKNWFIVNNRSSDNPSKPSSRGYFNKDPSIFKSVLLSGPPGIGKTTTATLVCKELGLSYVEMNASSTRSKNNLQDKISQLLSNYSLLGCEQSSSSKTNDRHVLIMDEVDGMAGNEDRGGVQVREQLF